MAAHVAFVVWVGGDALPAWRLFVPVIPVAAWLAGGLAEGRAGGALVAAVAAVQLSALGWDGRQWPRDDVGVSEEGREVGRWLRAHFPSDTVIATNTAGSVPYFSRLPAIDMLGLCDETIAHTPTPMGRGLAGHERANGAYVWSRQPELVQFGSALGRFAPAFRSDRELLAQPGFRATYVPEAWRLPSGRVLRLWRRADVPAPDADPVEPGR